MKLSCILVCLLLSNLCVAHKGWESSFGVPLDPETFCTRGTEETVNGVNVHKVSIEGSQNKVDLYKLFKHYRIKALERVAYAYFDLEFLDQQTKKVKKEVRQYFILKLSKEEVTKEVLNSITTFPAGVMMTRAIACVITDKRYLIVRDFEQRCNICVNQLQVFSDPAKEATKFVIQSLYNSAIAKKIGEGGFGVVKKVRVPYKELPSDIVKKLDQTKGMTWIAIKRMSLDQTSIQELFISEVFSVSPYGVKFYGCEYNENEIYIAQELMVEPMDKYAFREKFANMKKSEKMNLMIEMFKAVKSLHDMGFTHNDIKPGNIMLNEKGVPKLIDFGMVVRIGGIEAPGGTDYFMSEDRIGSKTSSPDWDVYAMFVTVAALHMPYGESSFWYKMRDEYDEDIYEQLDMEIVCQNMLEEGCSENKWRRMQLALERTWDLFDGSAEKVEDMNFTTLALNVVRFRDRSIKIDAVIKRMEQLRDQIIAAGERLI